MLPDSPAIIKGQAKMLDERDEIIQRAREKYIDTGLTRNVTEALRLYLANDASPDEQIPLYITTPEIRRMREILKQIRPRCDDCDGELQMQTNALDRDGKKYPTAWICKKCGMIYYSDKSLSEWLKELNHEDREQKLRAADESDGADVPA